MCVNAKECVVLLHGLARTESSMSDLAEALSAEGYKVVNQGYASRKKTVEELSEPTINAALHACGTHDKVHFVTHSMGGILVRYFLQNNKITSLGRVVMLGPPNQGSEVVDKLAKVPGFKLWNGPAGLQLGTGKNSLPKSLGGVEYEVGIIAGSKSINLLLSNFLPNPDDGKVSVESTKLEGMRDHIVVPATHTFMMQNKDVIQQVIEFLRAGKFAQKNESQ